MQVRVAMVGYPPHVSGQVDRDPLTIGAEAQADFRLKAETRTILALLSGRSLRGVLDPEQSLELSGQFSRNRNRLR